MTITIKPAKKAKAAKVAKAATAVSGRMTAPEAGVKVRMYRQGHGDCFLLAMPKTDGSPFYMLIDCGLWSNSEISPDVPIGRVIADIAASTGGKLDAVLVTHEHMDHVNGFAKKDPITKKPYFDPISIESLWLAWTEKPDDPDAIKLRERFNDTLLALAGTDAKLGEANHAIGSSRRQSLRRLLAFETGDEGGDGKASAADGLLHSLAKIRRDNPSLSFGEQATLAIDGITNKRAIKSLREKLGDRKPTYLNPGKETYSLNGVEGIKVYALGPPRDPAMLLSLNPKGDEEFKFAIDGATRSFAAAVRDDDEVRCFPSRFGITPEHLDPTNDGILKQRIMNAYANGTSPESYSQQDIRDFFSRYGAGEDSGDWRKIDDEWLMGSDALALRLNNEVNNTSAVIAIELPQTGKVLLFSGDAQRGSWVSWSKLTWDVDGKEITARDLLGRTVFYKVGHHGSHNATLDGSADSDYANLSWMGLNSYADDFVAVIPANEKWALAAQDWHHPLKSILDTLHTKARGRVFRSDVNVVPRPAHVPAPEWDKFQRVETDLYFEYTVADS